MIEVHLIVLLVTSIGYYLALAGILLRIIVSNEKEDLVERELIPLAKRRRELARREVMYELMDEQICRKNLRMSPNAFKTLCELLRGIGLIRDNQYSYVKEQVSKCFHVLAHGTRCSLSSLLHRRSSETVSRHFHQVLRAIISLEDRFFIQPDGTSVLYEIKYSGGRFSPYFENCVGAIDRTHIRVKVKNKDVSRYRGRKLVPTMNALAACTFDLHFTYVLPGWEESASDSRILDDALRREDKLIVPQGIDKLDQMQARQEIHLESFDQFVEVSLPTNSKEECSSSRPKPKSKTLKRKAVDFVDLLVSEMSEVKDVIKEMVQVVKVAYPSSKSQDKIAEELKKMGFIGDHLIEAIEYLWLIQDARIRFLRYRKICVRRGWERCRAKHFSSGVKEHCSISFYKLDQLYLCCSYGYICSRLTGNTF